MPKICHGWIVGLSKLFSFYEQLAYKIKCLLFSSRKGNMLCIYAWLLIWHIWWSYYTWHIRVKGQQPAYTICVDNIGWHLSWTAVVYKRHPSSHWFLLYMWSLEQSDISWNLSKDNLTLKHLSMVHSKSTPMISIFNEHLNLFALMVSCRSDKM